MSDQDDAKFSGLLKVTKEWIKEISGLVTLLTTAIIAIKGQPVPFIYALGAVLGIWLVRIRTKKEATRFDPDTKLYSYSHKKRSAALYGLAALFLLATAYPVWQLITQRPTKYKCPPMHVLFAKFVDINDAEAIRTSVSTRFQNKIAFLLDAPCCHDSRLYSNILLIAEKNVPGGPILYAVQNATHPQSTQQEIAIKCFDPKTAVPFCEKSLSQETRRAYHRLLKSSSLL
jgi:hypothetical protein